MLNQANRPFHARKIYPTMRGKSLLVEKNGTDLCFNFLYLRTIMDDKWLSYPKDFFDDLYDPLSDYSHLYDIGKDYQPDSIKSVYNDAKKALLFLSILSAAYKIEIQNRKSDLHKILEEERLIPDLLRAKNNIVHSAKGLLDVLHDHSVNEKVSLLRNMSRSSDSNDKYEKFFQAYYYDSTAVVSP
jgi:hypothetical protein